LGYKKMMLATKSASFTPEELTITYIKEPRVTSSLPVRLKVTSIEQTTQILPEALLNTVRQGYGIEETENIDISTLPK
jgi:hypothetical protein